MTEKNVRGWPQPHHVYRLLILALGAVGRDTRADLAAGAPAALADDQKRNIREHETPRGVSLTVIAHSMRAQLTHLTHLRSRLQERITSCDSSLFVSSTSSGTHFEKLVSRMATEAALSPQEKIALIKDQLQEVLKPEIIEDVIVKQNRPLKIYWGTLRPPEPHSTY